MAGEHAGEAMQSQFETPPPHTIRAPVRCLTAAVTGGLLEAAAAQQLTCCCKLPTPDSASAHPDTEIARKQRMTRSPASCAKYPRQRERRHEENHAGQRSSIAPKGSNEGRKTVGN